MARYHPLRELILARMREFFREPEAIFWVYIFPVFLAIGLGMAFRNQPLPVIQVGIAGGPDAAGIAALFKDRPGFEARILPLEEGRQQVVSDRLDVLVESPAAGAGGAASPAGSRTCRYLFDATRIEKIYCRDKVDRVIQRAEGSKDPVAAEDAPLSEPGTRYIDFLLPGLMGMNLMGGGLYGMGFVIVDMRVRKLLKRFLATPMRRSDFFIAMLLSRIIFLIPEMLFLLSVAVVGFGVPLRGGIPALTAVVFVSALSFSGLGLLVATRARKLETISGLMNLVMLPMWLLSGIFFNTARFPDFLQPFIQALPLTATNNALRSIFEGETLASQAHELLILAAWGTASYLLSFKMFRWI